MTPRDGVDAIASEADALCRVHAAVTALEPRAHARPEHAAALINDIVAPLQLALAETIAIAGRLEWACDVGDPETGEWGEHLEPTQVDGPLEADRSIASRLADQLWQQVGNIAFAARSELRRAERFLAGAEDHDQRVVASESARRKLRRALHAILDMVGQALGREYALTGITAEVEAALAVRRLYAKLRRSLPVCDPEDPGQVRRSLRLSAVSLAVMVGSADFGEIRAPDRQLLLGLQGRILAWARDGATPATGRQLYLDLQTAADLLRDIDRRQELVAHDQGVMARIERALASPGPAEPALAAIAPELRAIAGKDDTVDGIAELVGRVPAHAVLAELRARLVALGWVSPAIAA